jgi:hypothetical protein
MRAEHTMRSMNHVLERAGGSQQIENDNLVTDYVMLVVRRMSK